MSKRKWNSGKPPFPHWYATLIIGQTQRFRLWRWWNGEHWSFPVKDHRSAEFAGKTACLKTIWPESQISWSDYWPANARVPRINPNKKG